MRWQQPAAPRDTHTDSTSSAGLDTSRFISGAYAGAEDRHTGQNAVVSIQKWGLWSHLCPEAGLGARAGGLLARGGEERSWGGRGRHPVRSWRGWVFSRCWGASLVLGPGRPFLRGPSVSTKKQGDRRARMLRICAGRWLQGGGGGGGRLQRGCVSAEGPSTGRLGRSRHVAAAPGG
ncbi:PREDICTED: uncharacterized protein LOC108637801 [Capra hircus]|uniref:uncharacterized protein LOC108637801 n=1 Tax=Capra hircus TaxID=9925 RepID=UPI0008476459|nr:PREDICTED: uncharacterized protein LOC108637801 [Capra hircus]